MKLEGRNFNHPDESLTFPLGEAALLKLSFGTYGYGSIQPGWRWSTHVKPIVKTESCQKTHMTYVISGRMGVRMDDGTEGEFGPGDVVLIPPGHDGWVVGDEPLVSFDWSGVENFAQPR
jgi:hypothetical protein